MKMTIRPLLAVALAAVALGSLRLAGATELTPESSDPTAPPPPPPPMPSTGTPGSATPPPAAGSTEAKLAKASEEDTGVGLHFLYIQPEIGIGWASLGSAMPAGSPNNGVGPAFGLGLGAELIAFELGARFRALPTSAFNLYTLGGEFFYQPGSGRFWPRLGVTVGYAWTGHWDPTVCAPNPNCDPLDVHGLDIGARGGFQYFVSSNFEIGGDTGVDLLVLSRAKIAGGATAFVQDASGIGIAATATLHLGWHYP